MPEWSALMLSGSGRYADPWHPFARTSTKLAELAREEGLVVDQRHDIDDAVAEFATGPLPDLVIADLGRPQDGAPAPATERGQAGLRRLVEHRPLLAVHAAASTFADSPAWTNAVGARWIPGVSWHPDRDILTASVDPAAHTAVGELVPLVLNDERYLELQNAAPGRTVLYRHPDDDGVLHPSIWLLDRKGIRSAYDAYGHDEVAYESPDHRALIRRILRWLLAGR
ncbi:ThuA domain-containing protein [Herbiconiux sp. CPCC 205716]|uniref:ThuA domain-containing protein n=1 Tax=Herbiconiux gentiana TaxID=2970912 RepID=A0ABT2GJQ8_9MICO|nr:ThuA domain-containing protein [Herbiconiux gentiana]MCS5716454.1 ThuA domain-containing protein [Herbiconiux gentiana]